MGTKRVKLVINVWFSEKWLQRNDIEFIEGIRIWEVRRCKTEHGKG